MLHCLLLLILTCMSGAESLKEQIEARKSASNSSEEVRKLWKKGIDAVRDSGIMQSVPVTGQAAPEFNLTIEGKTRKLSELYEEGPLVLTFYRGAWCPYCIMELKAWERQAQKLKDLNLTVIGISPELPSKLQETRQKANLKTIQLASDRNNQRARQMGLVFTLHPEVKAKYQEFGLNLEDSQGNSDWQLPMPGTYLIDTSGIIRFAKADPDYTVRAEPEHIMTVLRYLD